VFGGHWFHSLHQKIAGARWAERCALGGVTHGSRVLVIIWPGGLQFASCWCMVCGSFVLVGVERMWLVGCVCLASAGCFPFPPPTTMSRPGSRVATDDGTLPAISIPVEMTDSVPLPELPPTLRTVLQKVVPASRLGSVYPPTRGPDMIPVHISRDTSASSLSLPDKKITGAFLYNQAQPIARTPIGEVTRPHTQNPYSVNNPARDSRPATVLALKSKPPIKSKLPHDHFNRPTFKTKTYVEPTV
jgi:hypothetical protein